MGAVWVVFEEREDAATEEALRFERWLTHSTKGFGAKDVEVDFGPDREN